jgi:hypothetical protein
MLTVKLPRAKSMGIWLPLDMYRELRRRAQTMNLPTSTYCRLILRRWLESGEKMVVEEKTCFVIDVPKTTSARLILCRNPTLANPAKVLIGTPIKKKG